MMIRGTALNATTQKLKLSRLTGRKWVMNKMTHEVKMQCLRDIFAECLDTADVKGRDYSGIKDSMGNFKDFGWVGIVVRIGDKYHRIKNLTKVECTSVIDESIDDTLMDMINYCALALIQKQIEDTEED